MTCADIQRKLSAYADGELTRWTRWKVQLHVGSCPDCAQVLRELEEIDRAFAGAVCACRAPEYLTDAVMRRLPAMPPPWRRSQNVSRWAAGVALAGVQLLAVYGAYWWGFAKGATGPGSPGRGEMSAPLGGASLRGGALRTSPAVAPDVAPLSAPLAPMWSRSPGFPLAPTSFTETIEAPRGPQSNRHPPLRHPVLQPGVSR